MLKIKVEGKEALFRSMNECRESLLERFRMGIGAGAECLLAHSKEIVPFDTGKLWNSGAVSYAGDLIHSEAHVYYSTEYAVFVHEDLDQVHGDSYNEKHAVDIGSDKLTARRPNEQAKFLEQPARDTRVHSDIKDHVLKAFK